MRTLTWILMHKREVVRLTAMDILMLVVKFATDVSTSSKPSFGQGNGNSDSGGGSGSGSSSSSSGSSSGSSGSGSGGLSASAAHLWASFVEQGLVPQLECIVHGMYIPALMTRTHTGAHTGRGNTRANCSKVELSDPSEDYVATDTYVFPAVIVSVSHMWGQSMASQALLCPTPTPAPSASKASNLSTPPTTPPKIPTTTPQTYTAIFPEHRIRAAAEYLLNSIADNISISPSVISRLCSAMVRCSTILCV